MKRQEFSPDSLRVIGRLAWMKDADEGHWFSVPSSQDKIVFDENGRYVHSITGVRIEIVAVGGDPPQIATWPEHCGEGALRFSSLVEYGQMLWTTLEDGVDPDALFLWSKRRIVVAHVPIEPWRNHQSAEAFVIVTRTEIPQMLKDCRRDLSMQRKVIEEQQRAERHAYLAENPQTSRKVMAEARASWRSNPEYDRLFAAIFGKSQSAITDSDPKEILYHVHCVVEFRLELGKWGRNAA